MKTLMIITALSGLLYAFGSSFCKGYKTGYKEGFCYQKYSCIAPITPICPIPRIGENSWTGGRNRGFMDGLASR